MSVSGDGISVEPAGEISLPAVLLPEAAPVETHHIEPVEETTGLIGNVKLRDFVKIFVDCTEIAELSAEQVKRIREMHEKIRYGFRMNFNYNVLLVVASILAGLGLVSNSNATVIASMLVSPIMGPVIGLAYGATIRDWSMVKRALMTELISIFACVAIGALIGLITGPTGLSDDWPTPEMEIRGDIVNLYISCPVAFFSGLGVAVSLLDDNTSSLVGVAISASLLPPAVNTGIIWVAHIFTRDSRVVLPVDVAENDALSEYVYPPDFDDYRRAGRTSIGITVANVFLVWISSMIMFRMKEVLPVEKRIFWEDLGAARKIYQNRAVLQPVRSSSNLARMCDD
ncbi:hypothetical protein FisN_22Hh045 [Fistulifera solaris]|uniref:DUF389 domain-containing protein n=1 Tax=Fistulifera solaris TaxID=1519565 RepID=A0A1Z5K2I4_FISSO|nr:hypothetical protein FisN_22Hh045 [Fistulifera solaris]|eukprot:GAX20477.1 hypothetical protein FisN_22Hh045 [Fistulifera solaris]